MRRIAITGIGLISPHGDDLQSTFQAWCEGRSAIANHEIGEDPHRLTVSYATCADFDPTRYLARPRVSTMDRVSQLSVAASLLAWEDAQLAGLDEASRNQVPVFWGTGAGGAQTSERGYRELFVRGRSRISPLSVVLGMQNAAASQISLQMGLGSECLTYSVACASSTSAIGEAFRRIRSGETDIALTGGAEAALPYGGVKAWKSLNVLAESETDPAHCCRPFHGQRTGLVLGEGAAALILEEWEHAQQRGATIYAELLGYGASADHFHLTTPSADGQLRALRAALRSGGLTPADVDYVNAHGTATPEGDPVEIGALRELFGERAAQVAVSSTKSMHGHLLGAAGAIETVATALALKHQCIPPTLGLSADAIDPKCTGVHHVTEPGWTPPRLDVALSNSFAFGGSNAVLALRRPADAP